MSFKNLNGLTAFEQRYVTLSEVYQTQYADHTLSSKKIMICEGIVITMYSELLEFLLKNKPTEKSKERELRLQKLMEIFIELSKVADFNYQMKHTINSNCIEINSLKAENNKLKEELKAIKEAWITDK